MQDITVKYKTLLKVMDILKTSNTKPDDDVKFEFIIGSCFPDIYKSIQTEMRAQYTQGYIDGSEAQQTTDEIN